jgi:hypothetical protein
VDDDAARASVTRIKAGGRRPSPSFTFRLRPCPLCKSATLLGAGHRRGRHRPSVLPIVSLFCSISFPPLCAFGPATVLDVALPPVDVQLASVCSPWGTHARRANPHHSHRVLHGLVFQAHMSLLMSPCPCPRHLAPAISSCPCPHHLGCLVHTPNYATTFAPSSRTPACAPLLYSRLVAPC